MVPQARLDSPTEPIDSNPSTSHPVRSRLLHEVFEGIVRWVVIQMVFLDVFIAEVDDGDVAELPPSLASMSLDSYSRAPYHGTSCTSCSFPL